MRRVVIKEYITGQDYVNSDYFTVQFLDTEENIREEFQHPVVERRILVERIREWIYNDNTWL